MKAKLTLEPTTDFEYTTPGLVTQHHIHYTIVQFFIGNYNCFQHTFSDDE